MHRYQDEWRGFVYPSRDNLLVHREIGTYSSRINPTKGLSAVTVICEDQEFLTDKFFLWDIADRDPGALDVRFAE